MTRRRRRTWKPLLRQRLWFPRWRPRLSPPGAWLAALAAVFLAASLVIETAVPSLLPLGRDLAVAGLVFLVLAVLAPYRPRR